MEMATIALFLPLLFEMCSYFVLKYEDFFEATAACAAWTKQV